ncbi:Acetate kinase [Oxalobacteraceae bacterium IMCC9480]|nr:Acetate kinase [Oxalobacteraceae bacterium IMCC9480]NDP59836.1 acetate/propionate family kinase [Oxalobacteraceae bacterium]
MDAILVINAGSSSIKFAAYDHLDTPGALHLLGKGRIALAGNDIVLVVSDGDGSLIESSRLPSAHGGFDHDAAMARLFAWLDAHRSGLTLAAVGHRVVHGGRHYAAPVRIDERVMADLETLVPLAPLHQPHNLAAIRILRTRLPAVPQLACFDTAFHVTQPAVAQAYALPQALSASGVRRYGFHGLSYEYVASQLPRLLGPAAGGKVIIAHLGNGASLCGLVDGRSVATTMGFSALDGLVMGTRCGSLDPGVVLYLLQDRGMTAAEVSDLLYRRSGLLGMSGISSDMQLLLASTAPDAMAAIDLFVYRIVCDIGALAAAMGGLDALVFTGGIGEHAAAIRARVIRGCHWLGARGDDDANLAGATRLQAPDSRVLLALVPTDEERVIGQHVATHINS